MQQILSGWRFIASTLLASVLAVSPSAASNSDNTDIAVRAALASGDSARVIMQFATVAERDAAFSRLLDRGAAVRTVDTEAGAALVVFGSAAAFGTEVANASRVSLDAGVTILADDRQAPARGTFTRRNDSRPSAPGPWLGNGNRNGFAVAVVDSGFAPHADLPLSRVRFYKDFVTGSQVPSDACGHGTHVAGIVAGDGTRSSGRYAGIAPHADIIPLRVLNENCTGSTSVVIEALEWIAQNHAEYKIRIVNLSLGHDVLESIFTDPLVQAVERLSRKGIVVVTAAGNKGINPATGRPGYGGVGVPCNAPSAICVGSLDTNSSRSFADDRVARSSGRGPTRFDLLAKPDMVAPGVDIVSLAAPGSRLFREYRHLRVHVSGGEAEYFRLSGTSMASPAVAGAAALVLEENAQLTANAVKMALQFTSRIVRRADVLTQGAGALNVTGALLLADAINPAATLGSNWITRRLTAANSDAFGRRVVWGRRIIYGDRFMQPRYAEIHLFRWEDHLVWGYDTLKDDIVWDTDDDSVVWGNEDNVVWGNEENVVWGNDDNVVWGNYEDENVVWGNHESDNVVWGIDDNVVWGNDDNVVWGNTDDDNVVWGNGFVRGVWAANVVWGFWDESVVWGNVSRANEDNVVWGNNDDNVVWGNCPVAADDNVVWGNDDNVVWGNDDNVVWGNCGDNVVWGNDDDNVVWGNSVLTGGRR